MIVAAVLVAGAAGAVVRFLVSRAFASRPGFPWAVLAVNVVGSAIGGIVLALWVYGGLPTDLRLVFITGFCGGLTTFSTFSVESVQFIMNGKLRVAAASILANLVLGIGGAALAWAVTGALLR